MFFVENSVLYYALALVSFLVYVIKRKPRGLPPGPPTGLLGDNRAQVPDTEPWKKFAEWSRTYKSSIISFYLGQTPNIVLHDMKTAYDLLDKRGEIYSGRARNITGHELMSGGIRGFGMQYGPQYRQWRKWQHVGMSGKIADTYRQFKSLESCILLRDIVATPDDYSNHLKRYSTSISFGISYGTRIKTLTEKVVIEHTRSAAAFGMTSMPGRYIVESWPILLWLPKPLQWFRREPERIKAHDTELYMRLFHEVKDRMEEGRAKPSMMSNMIENAGNEMSTLQMAYGASTSFTAGISTVTATMEVFLLAMLHHPQELRKAQAEMDSVIGQSRMPSFEDESSLPFFKALLKEVMRWRVIASTAISHAVSQDDRYEGYFIPKGTIVRPNTYAISKDPEVFSDPEAFLPERFLNPAHPRVAEFDLPFGFGRRICPGQHIAMMSLFIVLSRLIWSFDILPALDEKARPILPDPDAFVGGLVRRPLPFKVRFVPRSPDVLKLIDINATEADVELKAWE